jgi:hypothetical protein
VGDLRHLPDHGVDARRPPHRCLGAGRDLEGRRASGAAERIPFRARVQQSVVDAVRFTQEVAPDQFDVRMLRWVSVAPDGRSVVYQALGKLWIRDLPNGTPRRLTRDETNWELYPAWSADGRSLVYTTWNDATTAPSSPSAATVATRDG